MKAKKATQSLALDTMIRDLTLSNGQVNVQNLTEWSLFEKSKSLLLYEKEEKVSQINS